jgi:4-oxalocrotonate tautomerase
MPVVTVQMFEGRSETAKAFLARAICDAVAELAGTSREGVHVIFEDVQHDNWAIGPRLASMRPSAPPTGAEDGPAYVSVSHVLVLPGKQQEYIAWRRDSVYPFMASHEGFLSSTLLEVQGEPERYVIINKWANREAQDTYIAKPRETELRVEAREFLSQLSTPNLDGDVVNVHHAAF